MVPTSNTRQRGFTLAEILVATAIFMVILLSALLIYDRSNKVFKQGVESSEMQQSTRIGFDKLVSDIRMAGFDFDRDGIPAGTTGVVWRPSTAYTIGNLVVPTTANGFSYRATTSGESAASAPNWPTTTGSNVIDGGVNWAAQAQTQFQQPDEQIEYAGAAAATIRGNFDYESDALTDHGRERAFEPVAGQFPVVTTANNEIATYALRSADNTKNISTFTFFADTSRPRNAYPGGAAESLVTIGCTNGNCDSRIDTTNNNPPYTLYRFTLRDDGTPDAGVPIADNVRSLNFTYYSDASGQTPIPGNTAGTVVQGAVGGAGQFNPNSSTATSNFPDRAIRSTIQSVRVDLVGMNSAPDSTYTNTAETLTAGNTRNFRQYSLSSVIVPRNIGLSGTAEPVPTQPGPFAMTGLCTGHCKVPVVYWNPPSTGNVNFYQVHWDTALNGPYTSFLNANQNLSLSITSPLNAGTTYFFKVLAINDTGRTFSTNYITASPVNRTKPSPPTGLAALGLQPSQVSLLWTAPTTNDVSANTLTCLPTGGGDTNGSAIPSFEPIQYRIYRGPTRTFDPATSGALLTNNSGPVTTWADNATTAPAAFGPPPNCLPVFYRIQALDACAYDTTNSWNAPADVLTGTSAFHPDSAASPVEPALEASAYSSQPPGVATGLTVNTASSNCDFNTNRCSVALTWNKVILDAAAARITVNDYVITRKKNKRGQPPVFDLTLPTVSGQAWVAGATASYTDVGAQAYDPADSLQWIYTYTVKASQCTFSSLVDSNPVTYPNCTFSGGANIIQAGANSGDGMSASSAWVMGGGDGVTVTGVAPNVLRRVRFELFNDTTGASVGAVTDSSAPFNYGFIDQTDNQTYRLVITSTNASNCVQQDVRYIQDEPTQPCTTAASPATLIHDTPNNGTGGLWTTTVRHTIENTSLEALTLKELKIDWRATTPAARLTGITFSTGSKNVPATGFSADPPSTGTYSVPISTLPVPPSSNSYTIDVEFAYSNEDRVTLQSSPISTLCLGYSALSDSGAVRRCTVVGNPGAGTLNPSRCD
ncbi:MAG TPA: prepilin-type N-terminal cleavage/methylation domain-containing protein [Thermoanaerobaculia bacterium]|nr:prepilin-type N-terminal cleavage/methylation domain-containing protein [Thermoanaerobaculia bacterium]